MARRWRYYWYDGAYFRGPADQVWVEQVWSPGQQKWLPYTGDDTLKQGMFGALATKQEAESQDW